MFWAILIIWALLSFWLHTVVHEGSHWLAAAFYGVKAHLKPYPHYVNGNFVFGYTSLDSPISIKNEILVFTIAPVVAESLWWIITLVLYLVLPVPNLLLPLFIVELIAPWVDIIRWIIGAYTRPTSDASIFRAALKMP